MQDFVYDSTIKSIKFKKQHPSQGVSQKNVTDYILIIMIELVQMNSSNIDSLQLLSYLTDLYHKTAREIRADYKTLRDYPEDIGFFSTFENGHEFHHICHEIIVSVQHFEGGHQSNLIFLGDKCFRLVLEDQILEDYYCDYIELRYILDGKLSVAFGDSKAVFRAGEICFMNSQAYHHEILQESECTAINVNMSARIFNELFLNQIGVPKLQKFLRAHLIKRGLEERFLCFTPAGEDSRNLIEDSFWAILEEAEQNRVGQMFFYQGYILQLMDHLSTRYNVMHDKSDVKMYNDLLMDSVSNYMKDHLQDVTLNDLHDTYHYHPNFFNSLIRKYHGVTFSQYLQHLRINRAKELLKDTSLNVDEIIYLVGYSNKTFFTRKFAEQTGLSPAKFRRNSRPSAHR